MVIDKPISENLPVLGPRLRAELERRVRELEAHYKPTPRDMRELAQLKEFLRITPIWKGNESETAGSAHARSTGRL
jgi:hypothetical protein